MSQYSIESPALKIHLNRPQLRSATIEAWVEMAVWGRGTGKSHGLISLRLLLFIFTMRGSMGGIVGATFAQLLTRTLPPVVAAWEQLGYIRDVHFVIGKQPPKHFGKPLVSPLNWERTITWFNGTVCTLISQDRPGSANGLSLMWLVCDEAKFIDKPKLDTEIMPAMRGGRKAFGHLPCYRGQLYATDMPTTRKGMWVFEYEEKMQKEQIALILDTQIHLQARRAQLEKTKSETYRRKLTWEIGKYEEALKLLRMNSIYYSEASAVENMDELGKDYFVQLKRLLPKLIYETGVLNIRRRKVEGGFYAKFDEDSHTYQAHTPSYLENLGYDFKRLTVVDSRRDGDVNPHKPLDIAVDPGANFNCLVVGQEHHKEYRVLNNLYVAHPDGLNELFDKFNEYYHYHNRRVINFYFDNTHIGRLGHQVSYSDYIAAKLNKGGWEVNMYYYGQAPKHESKHLFMEELFMGQRAPLPRLAINRDNCDALITSIENAGVQVVGAGGIKKDKSSERDSETDQSKATHLSDAFDMLLYYKYERVYNSQQDAGVGVVVL